MSCHRPLFRLCGLALVLMLLPLLPGCSEEPDCSQVSTAWQAEVERKNMVIDDLQKKLEGAQEMLRKKHEEVQLNKMTPETMNRELVGEQQRSARLEAEIESLRVEHERLLVRYSSLQRELQECQHKRDPSAQ